MFSLTHVYILLWHLPLMQPARSAVKTATSMLVKPLPITQGTVWKGMRACKTLRGVFQGREFWRSSLRGYDQQLTCELDLGNLRLLCPRNVCPPFPQPEAFQGWNLDRVRCYWDSLEWVCDWTQLSPLYELFRYWWAQRSTPLAASKDKPCKFPGLLNTIPTIWRGLSLKSVISLTVGTPVYKPIVLC